MFNVTGGELFMILLVALIVLGPERLPSAARKVGQVMGQLRDLSEGFKREVSQALDDPSEPLVKPVTRPMLTALDGGAHAAGVTPDMPEALPQPLSGIEAEAAATAEVVPDTVSEAAPGPIADAPGEALGTPSAAGDGTEADASGAAAEVGTVAAEVGTASAAMPPVGTDSADGADGVGAAGQKSGER